MLPTSEKLVRFVERHAGKRTRELAEHFQLDTREHDELVEMLMRHQIEGTLVRVPHAGWDLPERTEYRVGSLEIARSGQGFARVQAGTIAEEDVFIPPDGIRASFPGDIVLLRVEKAARSGGRDRLREGRVVDVVRRSRRPLRGKYFAGKGKQGGGRVQLADKRFETEVSIAAADVGEAKDGERVLVRILDGPLRGSQPCGRVVVCLKHDGSHDTDLRSICEIFELPGVHPEAVLAEATALPGVLPGAVWPNRLDLRSSLVFTIDPVDARDFDDAISLERLKGDAVRLGVHIADVSHYVRPGTALNDEAEARGTSIYLPGQVIPMLPERLANDLCSLRPAEDRLTKSVFITYNARGEARKIELCRSVIRSQRRFTYDEALAILEFVATGRASAELPPDHAAYDDVLRSMAELRDKLCARRQARGALSLDIPKLRLTLDGDRNVAGLDRDTRDPSHSLIEEFMLAANEAVAEHFIEHKLPLVSRTHPAPEEKKLGELKTFVEALGFRFSGNGSQSDLQKLVASVAGEPLSSVVQLGLLRTMGHAEYVHGSGLHFALATSAYCHFTSPIRRYPDLLIHQLLDAYFDGELARATIRRQWDEKLPLLAERSGDLERRAEEAEREMTSLRLIRYLKPKVGQEMEGRIVSIHAFGFFVRVEETLVEGLVHVSSLDDDYYEFEAKKLILEGRKRRRRFSLGDLVKVVLADVDPDQRQISFRLKSRRGGNA